MNRLTVAALRLAAACDSQQAPPLDTTGSGYISISDAGVRYDRGPGWTPPRPDGGDEDDAAVEELPDDGLPADVGPPRDAAEFELVPFAVETRVGQRRTPAGLENRVTCQILDQVSRPIESIRTAVEVHPDTGFERTENGLIGHVARDYRLICTAPGLGLRDATPADWTVTPAAPARVSTALTDDEIEAGGETTARCSVFDAFGNALPAAGAQVVITPPPAVMQAFAGGRMQIDSAGTFDVTCVLTGAESAPGVALQVQPGLPARLAVGLFPDRPVYRVGAVVELSAIVTDAFENTLPNAPLAFTSDPELPEFGEGRFRCDEEGRYTLTAFVDGPTDGDRELTQSVNILVDFGGPGISCDHPEPGEHIVRPAGGHHTVSGRVADIAGLRFVRVDGEPVDLAPDGTWRADRPVEWGLNVHDVIAVDEFGNENSTFSRRPPLAVISIRLSSRRRSSTSRPTSDESRMPVPSSSSTMRRSRAAASPLRARIVFKSSFCSAGVSSSGGAGSARRSFSVRAGLRSSSLVSTSQPKNERRVARTLFTEPGAFGLPSAFCCTASPATKAARSAGVRSWTSGSSRSWSASQVPSRPTSCRYEPMVCGERPSARRAVSKLAMAVEMRMALSWAVAVRT